MTMNNETQLFIFPFFKTKLKKKNKMADQVEKTNQIVLLPNRKMEEVDRNSTQIEKGTTLGRTLTTIMDESSIKISQHFQVFIQYKC